jgi:hypothetical protein
MLYSFAAILLAATLTPSQLLSDAATYEAQTVTVSGSVSHLEVTQSGRQKVTGFQLCDSQCVVVLDATNTKHKNGDMATVTGIFQQSFKGLKRTFTNVLVIH